jgi:3-dehydroquinate dehydratase
MTDAIPVIDLTDTIAERPGAIQHTACAIHDALTQVDSSSSPVTASRPT